MSANNDANEIVLGSLIQLMETDSTIREFKFYKEFVNDWSNLLKQNSKNKLVYYANNTSDDDQAYEYILPISNINFELDFSIKL